MLYRIKAHQIVQPQWFHPNRAHWALIPKTINFSSAFFRKFDFAVDTLPIIKTHGDKFQLHPELARSWRTQEDLYHIIAERFDGQAYSRPLPAQSITWPSDHRYADVHEDEKVVRWRCMLALMRFREHWGLLAYCAFRHTDHEKVLRKLMHERPLLDITEEWLKNLADSKLLSPYTPRVGAVVDVVDLVQLGSFRRIFQPNTPLWIRFATINYSDPSSFTIHSLYEPGQLILPNQPNLSVLASRAHDLLFNLDAHCVPLTDIPELPPVYFADWPPAPLPRNPLLLSYPSGTYGFDNPYEPITGRSPSPILLAVNDFTNSELETPLSPGRGVYEDPLVVAPPSFVMRATEPVNVEQEAQPFPLPRSGQEIGQNWYDFMRERGLFDHSQELDEDPEAQAVRLALLQQAEEMNLSNGPPPRLGGFSFFEWVVSDAPDFLLRRAISEGELDLVWAKFIPSQRLFNSHSKEWDLCRPLDPNALDDCLDVVDHSTLPKEPTFDELQLIVAKSENLVIDREKPLLSLQVGERWVEWRFGCYCPPNAVQARENWRLRLGAGMPDKDPQPPKDQGHLSRFTQLMGAEHLDVLSLSSYLDILPGHRRYLDPSQSKLFVERLILRRLGEERVVYRLYPHLPSSEVDHPWFLAVEDASAVVLAIRQGWGVTRDHLTRHFMQHGIPFHTLRIQLPTNMKKTMRFPSINPLPTIPFELDTLSDYATYEFKRETFFSSERGKAMARYGASIRRLYMADALQANVRLHHVLTGPTELASFMGSAYSCVINGEEAVVYEDTLTEMERAFVVGQYSSPDSKRHFILFILSKANSLVEGSQKLLRLSWHMPFDAVCKKRFGSNGGIWNNADEDAHVKRTREILTAKAKPLTATDWQKRADSRKALPIERNYEKLCASYLTDYALSHSLQPNYRGVADFDGFIPLVWS